MARRRKRKLADRIRIGQQMQRRENFGMKAKVYQVWRKTEQAQIIFPNGGKAIYGFKDLEKTWYCPDWESFDPTQD